MKIAIYDSADDAATAAAKAIAVTAAQRPDLVLGVATGSSPQPLYRALGHLVQAGQLDLRSASAFALDEYVGLDYQHPESYHSIVQRDVTAPLNMDAARVRVPEGLALDLCRAATAYEAEIALQGGIDLQILGIGGNGHIGFNEPGSPVDSRTRVVDLTGETRSANSRFFPSIDHVPTQAMTQGLATIMAARSIVLVANGIDKADAVRRAIEEPADLSHPASLLQRHPRVTFYLDAAAASELSTTLAAMTAP
ncbi:glucosamine-6-phosphate deaminase [Herbiconiux sp. 11R-BC]|uniref:glucosamine-6-phosphate deaminase n=1 Tax=Herbiconiux sp. 11R-BC TaxID=3111637 RepID=UPI003C024F99